MPVGTFVFTIARFPLCRDDRSGRHEDGAGDRRPGSRCDRHAVLLHDHNQGHERGPQRDRSKYDRQCKYLDSRHSLTVNAPPRTRPQTDDGDDRHANSRRDPRA